MGADVRGPLSRAVALQTDSLTDMLQRRQRARYSENVNETSRPNPTHSDPRWKEQPGPHQYDDATSYLSLVPDASTVAVVVEALRVAPTQHFKAKDILRPSGLEDLPEGNIHVARDIHRIRSGEPISQILPVRGDAQHGLPPVIADGYHRVCAIHDLSEDAEIECRIVSGP